MLPLHTIPVVASAYCDSGRTATGTYVHTGTIAVDPRIIPLRSRVRIVVRRLGSWIEGFVHRQSQRIIYHAEDTGGKIKGARIDLWMPSCSDAMRWGMKRVDVVLETPWEGEGRSAASTRRRSTTIFAKRTKTTPPLADPDAKEMAWWTGDTPARGY